MLSPKIRQARRARSKSLVMGEQSRSPGRLSCPQKLGPVLKAGWLKKQRSIMKNWQQRWFVLCGDQLFYYKDKDETKPQGFISLQGMQVTELLPGPEDMGKHLFEISPGGAGEREKVPANPEALLLMANSQRDMEDWVQAIRRVIWAPFGGGTARSPHAHPLEPLPPGIFGQRLEDTVHQERKYGPRLAPLLVEQCVDFIRERGLTEEGLFRMPGQANLVRDLQDSFDCGEKPLFDSTTDVHTVASLLKLYLRELPEPVVPFARYEDFLSCAQLLTKDEGEGTLELAKQVSSLPLANYNLLRYICKFLDEVQSHSNVNKMSVQNLATVFGPNILRPQIEDPVTIMEGTSLVQHLMTVLIRRHGQLFTARTTEGPASPHGGTPCTVGWGSEEVTRDSQAEPSSPGTPGLPSHRTSSLDGATVAALSRNSPLSPATSISGKRMQTLPNWKSFRQSGSRSGSLKVGSSSLEVPIISSGGNWLMNGLSSLRGHRRASSGDWLKDSGSSQRLSTYDNVPPPSLFPSTPSVASMAWSGASACEPSTRDSISSCTACRASDSSACSSLHTEASLEPSPLPSSSEDHRSPDLGHSQDEVGTCLSSSEPSNPGSPAQDHARRSEALQGLVTELRAELCRQRTEYETSVKRLEEASADLRKRMSWLEEELDQEKKKYTMLEIKLRNSERAREDAEKRNQLLQKEMEEFFSTLGTLTVGAKGAGAPK
ncbi:rho GTPase-activating protein 22 isoform X2 [Rousettus aegyptiacus]|uniref:Rho GTPase activating protein 22 n=1 Tax=Rousettus aegyptiacus TaxID=9407 RepID=A0A7J8G3P7_ROUAE|nr:rho GTPase-activating protein 22 isoform X2 [Rousettus aegyptiacus]KAF6454724.1 Rho GTPase activating protein 22 [Rousettus aegyptiacus]